MSNGVVMYEYKVIIDGRIVKGSIWLEGKVAFSKG
jgi:hypothetical protein